MRFLRRGLQNPFPRPIPRFFAGLAFETRRFCEIGLCFAHDNRVLRMQTQCLALPSIHPLGSGFSHKSSQEPDYHTLGSRIFPRYTWALCNVGPRFTSCIEYRTHRNSIQLTSLPIHYPILYWIRLPAKI